jgi:hypothetical protein
MGGHTRSAIVTGILTCAALVVGATAFPVVKTEVAQPATIVPLPASEPAPAPRPVLQPMIQPDDRTDEVLRRLARLEAAVEAFRAEFGDAIASLEPLVDLAEQVNARKAASERSSGGPESAKPRTNETAAFATLRNIISAQAQVQASGRIDVDSDGVGEYGGFLELSGALAGRMANRLVPPVLSGSFRTFTDDIVVVRSGYCFRIFLPTERGVGIGEAADGFDSDEVDPDLCETTWCCYAWPLQQGDTGARAFFANQAGDILASVDASYSGSRGGPDADAAFTDGRSIVGAVAIGRRGADGYTWKPVN